MKRLVIVIVALILALSLSCAVAVLAGQRTVANSTPSVIDLCKGLPCFSGVTPGLTPIDDVRKFIARRSFHLVAYKSNVTAMQFIDGTRLDIFSNAVGTVDAIYINPADGTLSVLDVVSKLGAPSCGVQLGPPDNQVIILFYPYAAVIVALNEDRLDMGAKVVYMEMLNASHSSNCDRALAPGEPHTPWQGFASMDHYAESLPH